MIGRRLRRLRNRLASLGGAIHEWGNPVRIARRVGDGPGPAEPATIAAERSEASCLLLQCRFFRLLENPQRVLAEDLADVLFGPAAF